MRLPKTSRRCDRVMDEIFLGHGDYMAGGSCSEPFLDLDGCRHRRPLVFGNVYDQPDNPLLESMFSGRHTDPVEWAVMWKEIGADGVQYTLRSEGDTDTLREIVRRSRLPVCVRGDSALIGSARDSVTDCTLILRPDDGGIIGKGSHLLVGDDIRVSVYTDEDFPTGMMDYRSNGLQGDDACTLPILADVSPIWERVDGVDPTPENIRMISMTEGMAALEAMMNGADMVIVNGPGAADMARVYGEELADL